jgi:hypothetical protein
MFYKFYIYIGILSPQKTFFDILESNSIVVLWAILR